MNDYYNEISVIGSLLISPECLEVVEPVLTPSDFESEICKAAFQVIIELRNDNMPVDVIIVGAKLKEKLGKDYTDWAMECREVTPTAANVSAYCQLVKQDANKRKLQRVAGIIDEGMYSHASWRDIATTALRQIEEIEEGTDDVVVSSADMMREWSEYYDKVVANPDHALCKTGYASLDKILGGGMFRQGMYVVGARPGMGKTALAVNIAENVVRRGGEILFMSLELSRTQIASRRIAIDGGICYQKLMNGGLSPQGVTEAKAIALKLAQRPFYIVDKSKFTVADIERTARRYKNLSMILVDYLGLVRAEEEKANKPQYEKVTEISADLKALAKQLKIPIVVLCQLNRENASTSDKRPQLQHLRDSGAIEQDADSVILPHRPEYYNAKKLEDGYIYPEQEDIELIVAKNRHGETGLVKLTWRGKTGEIFEIDTIHEDPFSDCEIL